LRLVRSAVVGAEQAVAVFGLVRGGARPESRYRASSGEFRSGSWAVTERQRRAAAGSGESGGNGPRALPVWVRLFLLLIALETVPFAIGLFDPTFINVLLPWPVSPLNARFIASLYVSVGATLLASQAAGSWREVRILVVLILTATALILAVTLARLVLDPTEMQSFPTLWLASYVLDPLLAALVLLRIGRRSADSGDGNPYKAAWIVAGAAFGLIGLLSLLAPGIARSIWPWAMTEPQSQLYGAVLFAFGAASALAARETGWRAARWLALLMFFFAALVLLSSFLHLGRFTQSGSAAVWFAFFFAQLLISAIALVQRELRPIFEGRRALG